MATGDYEGKILIWKLSTTIPSMELSHEADPHERSVDRLEWLSTKNAKDGSNLLLLLSAGGDGKIRVWKIAQSAVLLGVLPGVRGKLNQVSPNPKG